LKAAHVSWQQASLLNGLPPKGFSTRLSISSFSTNGIQPTGHLNTSQVGWQQFSFVKFVASGLFPTQPKGQLNNEQVAWQQLSFVMFVESLFLTTWERPHLYAAQVSLQQLSLVTIVELIFVLIVPVGHVNDEHVAFFGQGGSLISCFIVNV
jgi:hypothetical protein